MKFKLQIEVSCSINNFEKYIMKKVLMLFQTLQLTFYKLTIIFKLETCYKLCCTHQLTLLTNFYETQYP